MNSILTDRARALIFAALLFVASTSTSIATAQVTAFSNFGPGNTYGSFGQTIGGQFINGYKFTSGASGQLSEIDIGIGGSGTFNTGGKSYEATDSASLNQIFTELANTLPVVLTE